MSLDIKLKTGKVSISSARQLKIPPPLKAPPPSEARITYEYLCEKGHRFDVTKSVKDIEVNEYCPRCDGPGVRQFVPSLLYISGARVTHAEYNPGLGCVVKNKRHKEDLMKQKGVVEVGNDFKTPDRMVDHFDKGREEKLRKRWEEA